MIHHFLVIPDNISPIIVANFRRTWLILSNRPRRWILNCSLDSDLWIRSRGAHKSETIGIGFVHFVRLIFIDLNWYFVKCAIFYFISWYKFSSDVNIAKHMLQTRFRCIFYANSIEFFNERKISNKFLLKEIYFLEVHGAINMVSFIKINYIKPPRLRLKNIEIQHNALIISFTLNNAKIIKCEIKYKFLLHPPLPNIS